MGGGIAYLYICGQVIYIMGGINIYICSLGVIPEKWCQRGKHILVVMIEDRIDYWLIGHVGRIRATKEKMKILRGGK